LVHTSPNPRPINYDISNLLFTVDSSGVKKLSYTINYNFIVPQDQMGSSFYLVTTLPSSNFQSGYGQDWNNRFYPSYPNGSYDVSLDLRNEQPSNNISGSIAIFNMDSSKVMKKYLSPTFNFNTSLKNQISSKPDSVFSTSDPSVTLGGVITNIADSIIPSIPQAQAVTTSNEDLPLYAGTLENVFAGVPNAPNLSTSQITEKSASIIWTAVGDTVPTSILKWHYVLKNLDNDQTIKENTLMSGQRNSYESNLTANTNYKAYVMAINAQGNSPESSISFKTLGATPTAPTPTAITEPELTFCVNVYNIRESGSVYSTHYESITQQKVEELQQTQLVIACEANYLPTEKQVQDFYNFTPLPPAVDTSIDSTMISQSIGAFILKDGRIKGEILYIANQSFNPFYYGKNLTSLVQIKSKSGVGITIKPNNLNFTQTERDERIQINEDVGNFKELLIDFFVWDSPVSMLIFSETKQIQVVEELPPPPDEPDKFKPCELGFHKDFSGQCVPDDPPGELPRDKLIDTLKGFLFGTVALSLLARKY